MSRRFIFSVNPPCRLALSRACPRRRRGGPRSAERKLTEVAPRDAVGARPGPLADIATGGECDCAGRSYGPDVDLPIAVKRQDSLALPARCCGEQVAAGDRL